MVSSVNVLPWVQLSDASSAIILLLKARCRNLGSISVCVGLHWLLLRVWRSLLWESKLQERRHMCLRPPGPTLPLSTNLHWTWVPDPHRQPLHLQPLLQRRHLPGHPRSAFLPVQLPEQFQRPAMPHPGLFICRRLRPRHHPSSGSGGELRDSSVWRVGGEPHLWLAVQQPRLRLGRRRLLA